VELVGVPAERPPPPVEAGAYFVVAEALTNVACHAHARRTRVSLREQADTLTVEVADDGGADLKGGSGLRGLADRVAAWTAGSRCRARPARESAADIGFSA
jgi:signal transduction histidine kinase